MRRLPKRKGISLGTITMLLITVLVVGGCGWFFPKLLGQTDFHFDARELAVAFDDSFQNLAHGTTATPVPTQEPISSKSDFQPVLVTAPTTVSFRLTAAGSIHIDTSVQKAMTDGSGYHFTDLFSALKEEIQSDLSLLTLENTLVPTEKLTDMNAPADVANALGQCGFQAVCLGHSGVLNSGISGLSATQDILRADGMTPYGVYASPEERDALTILKINQVSVALLSYQSELNASGKKKASREEQAFAIASPTLPTMAEEVQKAKSLGAQVVIVSLCWGKEGAASPTQTQQEMAQALADAGADIIVGTHSGTLQTVEILTAHRPGGKTSQTLCAYSLGNLFSNEREKRASLSSILLHANITYDLSADTVAFDQLTYTPTYVWRGKKADRTVYAVFPSDLPPPEYMQEEQVTVMKRSLTLVQDVMKDTRISQRRPSGLFQVSSD